MTSAVKPKVEMKYLYHETNLRRIQLEKEIPLAGAEEEAIKLVTTGLARKDAKSDERFEESFCKAKFDAGNTVIKHEPSLLRLESLPFVLLMPPMREAASQDNNFALERDKPTTPQYVTLKQIVSLQTKQAKLSTLIVNQ